MFSVPRGADVQAPIQETEQDGQIGGGEEGVVVIVS
jgi:hypothetical protein